METSPSTNPSLPPTNALAGYTYVVPNTLPPGIVMESDDRLRVPMYRAKANIGVLLGMLASAAGFALNMADVPFGTAVSLMGTPLFVYGCWYYAKSKGRPGGWAILGVFGLIGLLVLALLPNRYKDVPNAAAERQRRIVQLVLLALIVAVVLFFGALLA